MHNIYATQTMRSLTDQASNKALGDLKSIKKFGNKGREATFSEMKQLNDR